MTVPQTMLEIAPPSNPRRCPDLHFYILLPGYDRIGPVSIREGAKIAEKLKPGHYRVRGIMPPDTDVDVEFELGDGQHITLNLVDYGLAGKRSLAQRFALMRGANSETFYRKFRRPDPPLMTGPFAPQGALSRPRDYNPSDNLPVIRISRQHKHMCHFWVGHCDSDARLGELLSEDSFYALSEEEQDTAFVSEFGETQGEHWYDHDFLEAGWETAGSTLAERFWQYSWAAGWSDELARRAERLGLTQPNCFIMLGGDSNRPEDRQVGSPDHVDRPGVRLLYAGVIEFEYFGHS